ncbi:unnamed protein product [Somion occarium]|uniref:DUF7137 domain-containing protein n=1 Tax=Somion occarium TaxID=3059160 RepID=A0ABP1DN07_9APHY
MSQQQQQQTPSPTQSGGSQSSLGSLTIPQTAPAGGLTITQPPQTATSYYKIKQGVTLTFGWNFTSLLSTPTHLTVSAICDNGNTYPVGPTDGIIPGDAQSVEWDLFSYNQAHPDTPLAQNSYTLHIWDDRGPGAAMAPGLFHENNALRFALYNPASYTPLASWDCSGCNVAAAAASFSPTNPVFISMFTTILVMILSGYTLLRQATR